MLSSYSSLNKDSWGRTAKVATARMFPALRHARAKPDAEQADSIMPERSMRLDAQPAAPSATTQSH